MKEYIWPDRKDQRANFLSLKNALKRYILRELHIIPPGTQIFPRTLFNYTIDLHIVPLLMTARWFCSLKFGFLVDSLWSNISASINSGPSDIIFFQPYWHQGLCLVHSFTILIHTRRCWGFKIIERQDWW